MTHPLHGRTLVPALFSALLFLAPRGPAQGFELPDYHPRDNSFLVVGRETSVRWMGGIPGIGIRAIYRPGSQVEKTEVLVEGGNLAYWKPKAPGLVKLEAYAITKAKDGKWKRTPLDEEFVSVEFAKGFPLGVVVMVLAALILFGGVGISIRALLRAPEPAA